MYVPIRLAIIANLLLLGACSILNREPADGPPPHPVDVSNIPNARPAPVVRTRAGNAPHYKVFGKTYRILPASAGYRERGIASWYGTKFHGRSTANGEIYNMFAMTAAHKTLPIPSYVKVTHVGNGRSVIVKINDRGPFVDNRIIDLSYAAARKLGFDKVGTALVDVVDVTPAAGDAGQAVALNDASPHASSGGLNSATVAVASAPPPKPMPGSGEIPANPLAKWVGNYLLQLGAFQQRHSALNLQLRIVSLLTAPVTIIQGRDKLHRVAVGPVDDQQVISDWRRVLEQHGLDVGHIVREDEMRFK
ncbi:MAG: septal ring lytic transglycosylase RlpA family protein [Pseudomonadota bacterium]